MVAAVSTLVEYVTTPWKKIFRILQQINDTIDTSDSDVKVWEMVQQTFGE
jgi:hypothetical protein